MSQPSLADISVVSLSLRFKVNNLRIGCTYFDLKSDINLLRVLATCSFLPTINARVEMSRGRSVGEVTKNRTPYQPNYFPS